MSVNIKFIINQITAIFAGDSSGHDCWHSLRVYKNALHIAENLKCDKEILSLAALLHDVDDEKLFDTQDFSNARTIMKEAGIDKDTIDKVISVIGEVSYRGKDTVVPKTMEGKVVQDSDRLDALGAIGIARTFAYGGSRGMVLYNPNVPPRECVDKAAYLNTEGSSVNHFFEKLFHLKEMMNTEQAKRIAEERDKYMHRYIEIFMKEWEGI